MDADKDTLYARWLSGDLSPEEEKQLKEREELAELEKIIRATDNLSLPPFDAEKGFNQLKKQRQTKIATTRPTRRLFMWSAAAAASIALLFGVIQLIDSGPDSIQAPNGSTVAHTFGDQSSVVLNAGSQLFFEESTWEEERTVKLIGEALFSVEKGKPFIVNTINGSVEVLGTSFNVRAFDSQLRVECYTGRVSVRYGNNPAVLLNSGEAINGRLGQLDSKQKIGQQKPLWTTGNARFYEAPVYRVFEELERQYNVEVKVSKITRPFSGTFEYNDLEGALEAICKPMVLKYEILEGGKSVVIRE